MPVVANFGIGVRCYRASPPQSWGTVTGRLAISRVRDMRHDSKPLARTTDDVAAGSAMATPGKITQIDQLSLGVSPAADRGDTDVARRPIGKGGSLVSSTQTVRDGRSVDAIWPGRGVAGTVPNEGVAPQLESPDVTCGPEPLDTNVPTTAASMSRNDVLSPTGV